MEYKLIDIADVVTIPTPRELTSEEEAALIAQYKSQRTVEALEEDYRDLDKQIAEGIDANELLLDLEKDAAE